MTKKNKEKTTEKRNVADDTSSVYTDIEPYGITLQEFIPTRTGLRSNPFRFAPDGIACKTLSKHNRLTITVRGSSSFAKGKGNKRSSKSKR